jgi:hypothetical protein
MPNPEVIAAVIFRIHNEVYFLLSCSVKIIIEFKNAAEIIIARTRVFRASLWRLWGRCKRDFFFLVVHYYNQSFTSIAFWIISETGVHSLRRPD